MRWIHTRNTTPSTRGAYGCEVWLVWIPDLDYHWTAPKGGPVRGHGKVAGEGNDSLKGVLRNRVFHDLGRLTSLALSIIVSCLLLQLTSSLLTAWPLLFFLSLAVAVARSTLGVTSSPSSFTHPHHHRSLVQGWIPAYRRTCTTSLSVLDSREIVSPIFACVCEAPLRSPPPYSFINLP